MIKIFKDTQLFLPESKLSYYERKSQELQTQYEVIKRLMIKKILNKFNYKI